MTGRTSLSARLRFGSNVPITGYYTEVDGALRVAERRNDARLPPYARLDFRANRTFNLARRGLTLFVEVLNVLNRSNLARSPGVLRPNGEVSGAFESLFPILPSAGLLIEF